MGNQDSMHRNPLRDRQSQGEEDSENQRSQNEDPEDNNNGGLLGATLDLFSLLTLNLRQYTCGEWKSKNLKFSDLEKASNSDNKSKYEEIKGRVRAL